MTARTGWHLGVNTLFLIPGRVGGSERYFTETMRALCRCIRARTLFTNCENDEVLRAAFKGCHGNLRLTVPVSCREPTAAHPARAVPTAAVHSAGRLRRAMVTRLHGLPADPLSAGRHDLRSAIPTLSRGSLAARMARHPRAGQPCRASLPRDYDHLRILQGGDCRGTRRSVRMHRSDLCRSGSCIWCHAA